MRCSRHESRMSDRPTPWLGHFSLAPAPRKASLRQARATLPGLSVCSGSLAGVWGSSLGQRVSDSPPRPRPHVSPPLCAGLCACPQGEPAGPSEQTPGFTHSSFHAPGTCVCVCERVPCVGREQGDFAERVPIVRQKQKCASDLEGTVPRIP